jgi:hypothetical protein
LLAKKNIFVLMICVCFNEFVDHGGRRGDTALTLARYPMAAYSGSQCSLDVLHWAMHPPLYRRIRMGIKIASNLPAFFVVVDLLLPTTIAK